jgi:RNA polymerase sigma factor for flagellar operon FliA
MEPIESELWECWKQYGGELQRLRIIEYYHPWLVQVARKIFFRFYISGTELCDYVHHATIGLLEAIERFDPKEGRAFKAFARKRLIGEILNNIISYSELSSVSREIKRSERAQSLIDSENGTPTLDRIKDITMELAISFLLDEAALFFHQQNVQLGAYQAIEHNSQCEYLTRKVKTLPDDEHRVIWLHYFQQLSFSEISHFTGISKTQIHRLHRNGLFSLQQALYSTSFS